MHCTDTVHVVQSTGAVQPQACAMRLLASVYSNHLIVQYHYIFYRLTTSQFPTGVTKQNFDTQIIFAIE